MFSKRKTMTKVPLLFTGTFGGVDPIDDIKQRIFCKGFYNNSATNWTSSIGLSLLPSEQPLLAIPKSLKETITN